MDGGKAPLERPLKGRVLEMSRRAPQNAVKAHCASWSLFLTSDTAPLAADEIQAWLALGAGGHAARAQAVDLLRAFGSATAVFEAGQATAEMVTAGASCSGLFRRYGQMAEVADRTQQWMAEDSRHHLLTLDDSRYPAFLLNSPDPPLVLHGMGSLDGLSRPAVAVVGSRHATPAGVQTARRLSLELALWGVDVVSGLAVGIDAAAHEGALAAGGPGSTIAVVASGLQQVYPPAHRALQERIKENGLVVSEHPLGTPALPAFFPQRNRIIAALGRAVLVVEATLRSGSLITARLAAEAGRDVFAVPGHLESPQSAGPNHLIKNGAGLFEQVGDLVESQPWAFGSRVARQAQPPRRQRRRVASITQRALPGCEPSTTPDSPGAETVVGSSAWQRMQSLLRGRPCDLAQLIAAAQLDAQAVSQALLLAELDGLVARLPGARYQWCGGPA